MNVEKSRVVSVFSTRNFKFLGFALGKGRKGAYVRVHAKTLKKAKTKLKKLTSRSQGRNVRVVMEKVKVFILNIPVAGYRQSGEMETVVPAIWEPLFRRFGNRCPARAYSGC